MSGDSRNPVLATVAWAFIAAVVVTVAAMTRHVWHWAPWLAFSGTLAAYLMLLFRWAGRNPLGALVPAAVPVCLSPAFMPLPTGAFILVCVVVLAWARSGIAFSGSGLRGVAGEILASGGAGLALALAEPRNSLELGLCVWLFFLLQGSYFLARPLDGPEAFCRDPFETARARAEQILSGGN
ncbi:MAG: hypothetical protein ACLFOY_14170 [Desulfatibacillaceae bacterium]